MYCCAGGVPLWCWHVRRASGFCGVIGISLIERKIKIKSVMTWLAMRGRKVKFKNIIHIFLYITLFTLHAPLL